MKNFHTSQRWTAAVLTAVAVAISLADTTHAQVILAKELVIYPATESETPLGPPLLPPMVNQIRGNAAVYYGKVTAEQSPLFGSAAFNRSLIGAHRKTLDELRNDTELDPLLSGGSFFEFLELAARCDSVDWHIDVHDQRLLMIMVPELQQCRQFSRILSTRVRLDIAKRDIDSAIRYSQANFALARHVAQGPLVFNALIGLGVQDLASDALIELVQLPQAPSLYWSLASLPHPLLNLDQAYASELQLLELTFPWLEDGVMERLSPEEWNKRLEEVWDTLYSPNRRKVDVSLDELVVFGYPVAKRRLVSRGWAPMTIDSLPVSQVLLADMFFEDKKQREAIIKWLQFSYPTSLSAIVEEQERQKTTRGFTLDNLTVSTRFDHSILVVSKAGAEQKMAMLQIVEALRLIAGDKGKLPRSLENVSYPPCPIDPVSGKPFYYESNGVNAVLEGSAFRRWKNRWEIKLASIEKPEE